MRAPTSLPPSYFETMFAGDIDPWRFETSPYEQAKYAHTIASLGGRRYQNAFEIGCATGVLTERLAAHCDRLLAVDVSETALARAQTRCASSHHVAFARMMFPREAPGTGGFDLTVLSEVAYYWDQPDLALAGQQIARILEPGGDLVLVHWTGETDYPVTGDDAVQALGRSLDGRVDAIISERTTQYRLDVWRRRPE